jgi:hypothetical protein
MDIKDVPVLESDQVSSLGLPIPALSEPVAEHAQECRISYYGEPFAVRWDGSDMRLMKPLVSSNPAVFGHIVVGHVHFGSTLPKFLDPITMERQANIVLAAYQEGLKDAEK